MDGGVIQQRSLSELEWIALHALCKAIKASSKDRKRFREKTKTTQFSCEQRDILKVWFKEHWDKPRPSLEQKNWLRAKTGLTLVQVENWFANERRRHWKRQKG